MEAVPRGLNGPAFTLCVVLIAALAIAQSVTHLVLILGSHRVGTMFDLDRSNGVPDLVSTVVLGAAAAAAEHGALRQQGMRRRAGRLLALALAGLTVADALHQGAHPTTHHGKLVIGLACLTGALLLDLCITATPRVRAALAVAGTLLVAAFLVTGLDRVFVEFQRPRGDAATEYRIAAKEDLELVGWSLVALALWDAAAGVRGLAQNPPGPPAPAPSRPEAAGSPSRPVR